MADGESDMKEGTYAKGKGKGHNGGVIQEMCANACRDKKGENKKGRKMMPGPKGGMGYGQAD